MKNNKEEKDLDVNKVIKLEGEVKDPVENITSEEVSKDNPLDSGEDKKQEHSDDYDENNPLSS